MKIYNKSINSLLRVSLCTWRASPAVNGVSVTWRKVLLLILVICLSFLTELIMTYPTMSISFSISSFLTQLKSSACFGAVIIQCKKDCNPWGIVNHWNVSPKSHLSRFRILALILAAWKMLLRSSDEL